MSGIAGIYFLDSRPVKQEWLKLMNDYLAFRGPDVGGHWIDGSLGFGHRMLWTTPESLYESQPLQNEDGSLSLTADARVDNRKDLKREIESKGVILRNDTDAELILKAYELWGKDCPEKIIGDFAFSVWDNREQLLFCARDRIGIKPFYYFTNSRMFVFASEISSIFEIPTVEKQINKEAFEEYLASSIIRHECTLFENIRRLPPACILWVQDKKVFIRRYWEPKSESKRRISNLEKDSQEFLYLFEQAIKAQLRSAYPIGCLLSGGLDSSSVLCVASRLNEKRLPLLAFSMIFEHLPCDEQHFIHEIVKNAKVDAYSTIVDSPETNNEKSLEAYYAQSPDWPVRGFCPSSLWPLLEEAKEQEVRVMLTGLGGDHVTAGNRYYLADLFRSFHFIRLFKELAFYGFSPSFLYKFIFKPIIPKQLNMLIKHLVQNKDADLPYISAQDESNKTAKNDYSLPKDKFLTLSAWQDGRLITHPDTSLWLEGWWNPLGSNFAIEFRHPFFDIRLIQFLLSIPPEEKFWHGQKKIILRHGMKGILPESIRKRQDKTEFTPLLEFQMKYLNLDTFFKSLTLVQDDLVDGKQVETLLARYKSQDSPWVLNFVWKLVLLETWYCNNFR